MAEKLKANTIHQATIIQAVKELTDDDIETSTSNIGEVLMRPQNYDMGNRLFTMCASTSGLLEKKPGPNGNNAYFVTEKGERYLQQNIRKVQTYGEYEAIGSDKKVSIAPSKAALGAMAELETLIQNNTELRAIAHRLYNEVDAVIREVEEGA